MIVLTCTVCGETDHIYTSLTLGDEETLRRLGWRDGVCPVCAFLTAKPVKPARRPA